MSYCSPCSSLDRSPEQDVGFAVYKIKNVDVVAANRRDMDRLVFLRTRLERPRFCLQHITAIVILGSKDPAFTFANRSMYLGSRSINHLDVLLLSSFTLENNFVLA